MVIVIRQPAAIRDEDLDQLGPVKIPLSEPTSRLIGRKYIDEAGGIDCMGIWECSPGRWQRTIMQEEFAHFLTGRATFIPEGGEPIDIRAGDTVWFPVNSRGIWEIKEDVRKVYVVIDRPSAFKRFRLWLRSLLAPSDMKARAISAPVAPVGVLARR
ncbi:MAG TPA: cupin domain-containing protein [Rhizomicrobium sp.]|nr:cupin domain-containing protein [Rhizomicrobium sp.]